MFKLRSFLSQHSQAFLLTLSQEKVVPNCPRLLPELFTTGFSGLKLAKQVPLAGKNKLKSQRLFRPSPAREQVDFGNYSPRS